MSERDPFSRLYSEIAVRKDEAAKVGPYDGSNGRINRAVSLIKNKIGKPGGTLVDIGGATGNLGYCLRDFYDERFVIDISDECRAPALSKGNMFICANVDMVGIDARSVDMITALDVIEHILNPEYFARECMKALKPGGQVLINTPNIQYWRHLQSLVEGGMFPHTSGDKEVYHGGHVAFFNMTDMHELFKEFVDHTVHVDGLTPDPPPPIWTMLAKYPNKGIQLSYADLIFSCRKPS